MNIDFFALTASLQDIVDKLADFKHRKPSQQQQTVLPPPSDHQPLVYMSYLQQLLFSLPPVEVVTAKQSYSLHQDLLLLVGLSPYDKIMNRHFDEVAHKMHINRTPESLRRRYNDYLYKIGENEMQKILKYIKQNGVKGYLIFNNNELHLTEHDPSSRSSKSTVKNKYQRPEHDEKDSICTQISPKGKNPPLKLSQEGQYLKKIINIYSKMVNIHPQRIVELLHQSSGNFVQLDNYIMSKDERLLWAPEDDALLMKKGRELDLLIKYRGIDSIKRRRAYLGLSYSAFPS